MPSAVGYQPTLATEVGELQERIASTKNGSVTSVQAVYVPADDLTDPAPATTFAHLDATTDYMPHKMISNVEQIKNLPLQVKANRVLISPANEVVKWAAGSCVEIELDAIYPGENIQINFGKDAPCTWGRLEISTDGKEWKTVDLKQKESRLSAGLQKAPVKFVRFTNVSDEEQQVYLRQFVLTIEKK